MCVFLVAAHGASDPVGELAHAGVHAGVSRHGALVTPGHDTLQLSITHQGATGVTLVHETRLHRIAQRTVSSDFRKRLQQLYYL